MANDSLAPYQRGLSETREESLTRQFYDWERRGRGWSVYNFPVELKSPLRPFYLFDPSPAQIIDDGRKPTFFSKMLDGFNEKSSANENNHQSNSQLAAYQEKFAAMDAPVVCSYYDEEFTELQLVLPKDLRINKAIAEQLLLSLSYASHPVSLEIIGTSR